MKSVFLTLSVAASLFSIPAPAASLSEDLLSNLYAMKSVYQANYAPAAWKKQFTGYDLQTNFNTALAAIQGKPNLTQQDSRGILVNFISAMRDYHTSISFVATESAALPLTFQNAEDRFFIGYIDRTKLSKASFPFEIGDELLSFGNKSALEAVQEVQAVFPENVAATDRARATINLTARTASRGFPVPSGPITLGIRRQGASEISKVQLIWNYAREQIKPRAEFASFLRDAPREMPMMSVDFSAPSPVAANPFDLGARKTFTPALGPKVWESEDSAVFHAYIYKSPDRRLIGYLRIPAYITPDYVKATAELQTIVTRFEAVTDGLVIDQVNNPGGSVFYLYQIASLLAKEPLATPRHRMTLTQAKIAEAVKEIPQLEAIKTDDQAMAEFPLKDTNGFPASYEFARFMLNQDQFLISEWEAGHTLTAPYWIGGVDHINPAASHYSKPILFLINHLDFSGGDFLPSILQDNKRVTIMGSRTAGAGGYVLEVKLPNNIGIDTFRYTGSIAERVGGNPIENLGVTPDLPYEISVEDLTNNYSPYVKAIQGAIDNLTK